VRCSSGKLWTTVRTVSGHLYHLLIVPVLCILINLYPFLRPITAVVLGAFLIHCFIIDNRTSDVHIRVRDHTRKRARRSTHTSRLGRRRM
jgi:hypothetical protein